MQKRWLIDQIAAQTYSLFLSLSFQRQTQARLFQIQMLAPQSIQFYSTTIGDFKLFAARNLRNQIWFAVQVCRCTILAKLGRYIQAKSCKVESGRDDGSFRRSRLIDVPLYICISLSNMHHKSTCFRAQKMNHLKVLSSSRSVKWFASAELSQVDQT